MNTQLPGLSEHEQAPLPPRKRVLIIDDDTPVLKAISNVLEEAGYEVFQAGDGQKALARFDPKQIDLLLLDLGLPNKSGWDTYEAFTKGNPTLPIIIITGRASQSEMAMAAGVGALMEKPLDAGELLQTMQDLLNESEETRLRRMLGYRKDGRYMPSHGSAHSIGNPHTCYR
jgi:DNA-binding response OmpR family regulator